MNKICITKDCNECVESEEIGGVRSLSRNIFGPFASRLVDGRCLSCAQKGLARAWMSFVFLLSLMIAMIELPWKGLLFALILNGFWILVCWRWLFPKDDGK